MYRKEIVLTDTGMVVGEVFYVKDDKDIERVGLRLDYWPFRSKETKLRKAHEWADKLISLCERLECRK